ncbi:MAG: 2-amino-4-hydroxy-6-hydroxymethyldihydropteridine diphosphokinase [Epsilonproteobacteria bacterium]|nr:2-amino-4-hydroxy-6-hydroxymethyldihydropteridine diphosphokinase [Campylobacterota bacterium]
MKFFKIDKYPYKRKRASLKKHYALVGIGGNIGDNLRRFQKLFYYLQKDKRVDVLQTSLILKNPPFGYLNQDDFYNAVILIKTDLTPVSLLKFMQKTEKLFKRRRCFKNSPRTLDLDIIFYDKITLMKPFLQIPHKKWHERVSVVLPSMSLDLRKGFILKYYKKNIKGAYETSIFHG